MNFQQIFKTWKHQKNLWITETMVEMIIKWLLLRETEPQLFSRRVRPLLLENLFFRSLRVRPLLWKETNKTLSLIQTEVSSLILNDFSINLMIKMIRWKGCNLNGTLYAEGSAVISTSFCEYCYCIKYRDRKSVV